MEKALQGAPGRAGLRPAGTALGSEAPLHPGLSSTPPPCSETCTMGPHSILKTVHYRPFTKPPPEPSTEPHPLFAGQLKQLISRYKPRAQPHSTGREARLPGKPHDTLKAPDTAWAVPEEGGGDSPAPTGSRRSGPASRGQRRLSCAAQDPASKGASVGAMEAGLGPPTAAARGVVSEAVESLVGTLS